MCRRSELPCLVAELNTHGVHDFRVEPGGRHPKLVFEFAGRAIAFPFSRTPSDPRGHLRSVSVLRHLMGVRPPPKRRSARAPRRRAADPLPPLPVMSERPDPWAPLAEWGR